MKLNLLKSKKLWQSAVILLFFGLFLMSLFNGQSWWSASRKSAGLAPDPQREKAAVVQVYAARTFNWRGYFAVHTWIATKEKNADFYNTYQVIGYRIRRGGNAVVAGRDIPDRYWFGAKPFLIEELRGKPAEKAIVKIKQLVEDYPYKDVYAAWPGPNSNTFTAMIIRNVPELTVELPPHAIGKDWLENGKIFSRSESGSGYQFSLFGLLGFTIGLAEGIEFNFLGLNFGIDFYRPALKLPLIGRVGMKDRPLS